jgi:hypothetical protein
MTRSNDGLEPPFDELEAGRQSLVTDLNVLVRAVCSAADDALQAADGLSPAPTRSWRCARSTGARTAPPREALQSGHADTKAELDRLRKEQVRHEQCAIEWEQKAMHAARTGDEVLAREALLRQHEHAALALTFAPQIRLARSVEELFSHLETFLSEPVPDLPDGHR